MSISLGSPCCAAAAADTTPTGMERELAHELTLRAYGRYTVTQETINHRRDRMDILVQADGAPDQLAIEIKHGGKGWSVRQLLDALEMQLGEGYLRPDTRRHGILIVTHHGTRDHWQHPETSAPLLFPDLMALLRSRAVALTTGQHHTRTLRAIGLDAVPFDEGPASGRKHSLQPKQVWEALQPQ